jgi:glycerol-3-phosphate dehydrogenase
VKRSLSRLASERFDVLVIGGGIYGLISAYDAAQRGLKTALVERGDFAGATSFNHFKTLHGGLRYLQHLDLPRIRESIRERRTMARIAPHLVSPLAFVMPLYWGLTRNPLTLSAAMAADAFASLDRNVGLPPSLHLPAGRVLGARECQDLVPAVRPGIKGGALWYDYQMHHSDRLALSFALAADLSGATLANHVEAIDLLRQDGNRVAGAQVRDRLSGGSSFDVRAKVTLNAAGPWAPSWIRRAGLSPAPAVDFFQNLNLVTTRPASPHAWVAPTSEGRALVAAPWQGRIMFGTYEARQPSEADDLDVPAASLQDFLAQINQTFLGIDLEAGDITLIHRGVVPAQIRNGRLSLKPDAEVWDHRDEGVSGLVSMLGVKYTVARAVAERAVNSVVEQIGRPAARCRTAMVPLPGGDAPDTARLSTDLARTWQLPGEVANHLVASHGTEASTVLETTRQEPALKERVSEKFPVILAEVVHAVREEMACRLTDTIVRRTSLGSAGHPGADAVRACAAVMQRELAWSDAKTAEEVADTEMFYVRARGTR